MRRLDTDLLIAAREGFYARGESVADWARERGFDPSMVYQVLAGRCNCQRGVSHQIAVALGLKASKEEFKEQALTSKEAVM